MKKTKLKKDGTTDKRYLTHDPTKDFKFTPEELLEKFNEYVEVKGFQIKRKTKTIENVDEEITTHQDEEIKYMPLSIVGFTLFLKVNSKYIHHLPVEKYGDVLDYINSSLEEHITYGISIGDIAQSFGIFYLKNKFKYTDKKEIEQVNYNHDVTEVTDDELKEIIGFNTK